MTTLLTLSRAVLDRTFASFSLLRHFFSQTTTAPSERGTCGAPSRRIRVLGNLPDRSAHDSSVASSTATGALWRRTRRHHLYPRRASPVPRTTGAPAPGSSRRSGSRRPRQNAPRLQPGDAGAAQPKEPATRPTTATGAAAAVNAPAPASRAPPPTAVAATLVASCTDTDERRLGGSSKDTCLCSSRSDCETMVQDARHTCDASLRTARTRASARPRRLRAD